MERAYVVLFWFWNLPYKKSYMEKVLQVLQTRGSSIFIYNSHFVKELQVTDYIILLEDDYCNDDVREK